MDAGEAASTLAFDVYIHRLRAYAGAYIAQLGGVDVISFTAGVGENAARCARGIDVDAGLRWYRDRCRPNEARERGSPRISTDASSVVVLVRPTNESCRSPARR
ncbi:hypothetical protein [Microbacterium sp. LWO12-1.2]|uniref:hypothetical protein n=1 Tax=Microbacterium sp. LWO12-1.2 TaxID=3135261 RepID=UPI0034140DBE